MRFPNSFVRGMNTFTHTKKRKRIFKRKLHQTAQNKQIDEVTADLFTFQDTLNLTSDHDIFKLIQPYGKIETIHFEKVIAKTTMLFNGRK